MVYISFVINAFKKKIVLLMLIKRLCVIYFLFIIINFWGVFSYGVVSSNVEGLGL